MEANIKTIMENEKLMQGIAEVTTPEEMMKLFSENNIELEEGLTPQEAFDCIQKGKNGELNEKELEDVNGGVIGTAVAVSTVGCFVLAGAALSFLGGFAYEKFRRRR